jgi:hypothetical protein
MAVTLDFKDFIGFFRKNSVKITENSDHCISPGDMAQ